jgi:hypothetical protein
MPKKAIKFIGTQPLANPARPKKWNPLLRLPIDSSASPPPLKGATGHEGDLLGKAGVALHLLSTDPKCRPHFGDPLNQNSPKEPSLANTYFLAQLLALESPAKVVLKSLASFFPDGK